MLDNALEIAKIAHKGQTDKGGNDYFTSHIMAVVNAVDGETEKIVAALHDVIEDTDLTLDDLRYEGFGDEVIEAVEVLTHPKGEPYMDYIKRVGQNPIARKVKIADIQNNMDLSRIPDPTEADHKRVEKYWEALKFLAEITLFYI